MSAIRSFISDQLAESAAAQASLLSWAQFIETPARQTLSPQPASVSVCRTRTSVAGGQSSATDIIAATQVHVVRAAHKNRRRHETGMQARSPPVQPVVRSSTALDRRSPVTTGLAGRSSSAVQCSAPAPRSRLIARHRRRRRRRRRLAAGGGARCCQLLLATVSSVNDRRADAEEFASVQNVAGA